MKSTFLICALFALSTLISSCSKYDAGTGGKAKITVKVINGNVNVPDVSVQVMYKARTFPGTDATYSSTATADNTGDAIFDNLKRGDYYFYCSVVINDTLREAGAFMNIASKFGEQHAVIDFNEEDPF